MATKGKRLPRSTVKDAPVGGRYELGALIGAGGMGRVYEGYDRVLGRPVAVKILDESRAGDPRFVEAFRREARAAAALLHPNIVSVFDTGSEDGFHYIVMERIRGRTLREVIAEDGSLDPSRAAAIAGQIAAALAAAHDRGLVHRDIKPGNVMLTEEGSVRVMDFGIARAEDEEIHAIGPVLGTAAYVPPEQARGRGVSPAGDVYSLGCVLYEMLTGRPPFEGESPVATVVRHVSEVPVPPSEVADRIPAALEAVVLRAMAKQPERRFRDGRRFGGALAVALQDARPEPPASGAVSSNGVPDATPIAGGNGSPLHRSTHRRRLPAGVLGVGTILVLGLLIGPAFISSRPESPPGRAEAATEVEIPDVVGMTETESVDVLHERGFIPRLVDGALDDGVDYVVAAQIPPSGARIDRGSFVTLRLRPADSGGRPGSVGAGQDGLEVSGDRSR